MKAYFVSDLHLKSEEKDKAKLFINFLSSIDSTVTHLVLLGDVFDFWIGRHSYFQKKFPKIIGQLQRIVQMGIQVHYFEGNHDIHLKKFWQDEVGAKVHPEKHVFRFGNLIVRAEHGDLMNPEDKGYLFLRWLLRTKPMEILSYQIPGQIVGWIGERSSQVSRVYTDRITRDYTQKVIDFTRTYAMQECQKEEFDLIITGHTHIKDDFEFTLGDRKRRSVNLGSWLDQPKFFSVTPDEQQFVYLK